MTATAVPLPRSRTRPTPDPAALARRAAQGGPFRRATVACLLLSVATMGFQNTVALPITGLSKLTGAGAAALGLIAILVEGRRSRLRDSHFFVIGFGLWVCLTVFWTIDLGLTFTAVIATVLLVALVMLANEFTPGRTGAMHLATAFVAGTVVPIIQLLYLEITGEPVFVDLRLQLGSAHPNDLAFLFAIGIPLAWWIGYTRRRWWLVAATLYVPGALYGIILTASRGGFIVGVLGALAIPWTLLAGRPRRAAIAGVVAVLLTPFVGPLLPVDQVTRLATTADSIEKDGLNGRTVLWEGTWEIIGERPLVGVGAGASRVEINEKTANYQGAHNTLLSVTSELGSVGLLLFLAVLLTAVVPAVRARNLVDRRIAILFGLVLIIGIQVRHWEYEKGTWLALSILIGMSASVSGEMDDRLAEPGSQSVEQLTH